MARFFNVRQAPLIDYSFKLPFQEIAQTQAQLQQRYDITAAGLEKAQDTAAAMRAYWDPDKEYLRGFQGKMDDLTDKYLGQNLADPAVGMRLRNDIRTLARDPNLQVIQSRTQLANQTLEDMRKMRLEGKFNTAQAYAWQTEGARYNASGAFDPNWQAPSLLGYADPKATALEVIKALPAESTSFLTALGAADGSTFHSLGKTERLTLQRIVQGVSGMLDNSELQLLQAEYQQSGSPMKFEDWLGTWLINTANGFQYQNTTLSGLTETHASKKRHELQDQLAIAPIYTENPMFQSEAGTLSELRREAEAGNVAAQERLQTLQSQVLPQSIQNAKTPQELKAALAANPAVLTQLAAHQQKENVQGATQQLGANPIRNWLFRLMSRDRNVTVNDVEAGLPSKVDAAKTYIFEHGYGSGVADALLAEQGAGDYISPATTTNLGQAGGEQFLQATADYFAANPVISENVIALQLDGKHIYADETRTTKGGKVSAAKDAMSAFNALAAEGRIKAAIEAGQYGYTSDGKPILKLSWPKMNAAGNKVEGNYTGYFDLTKTNLPKALEQTRESIGAGPVFDNYEQVLTQTLSNDELAADDLAAMAGQAARTRLQVLGIPEELAAMVFPEPSNTMGPQQGYNPITIHRDVGGTLTVSYPNYDSGLTETRSGLTPREASALISERAAQAAEVLETWYSGMFSTP